LAALCPSADLELQQAASRILPIAESMAERWGILEGECRLRGIGFNAPDGLIAATALAHELTVVTRNVRHFAGFGVAVFNPWEPVQTDVR
jgi:predicted nucleic acid-binding protein